MLKTYSLHSGMFLSTPMRIAIANHGEVQLLLLALSTAISGLVLAPRIRERMMQK